jgi:hypothetical protein
MHCLEIDRRGDDSKKTGLQNNKKRDVQPGERLVALAHTQNIQCFGRKILKIRQSSFLQSTTQHFSVVFFFSRIREILLTGIEDISTLRVIGLLRRRKRCVAGDGASDA